MSQSDKNLQVRVSGLWNTTHRISGDDGPVGTVRVRRNMWGMVVAGEYQPEKGEQLSIRRDPGLLRSQFSLWTEAREWLGSSLRWSVRRREVSLSTGQKALRLLPLPGWGRGWLLVAPRTGEMARIRLGLLGRAGTIEIKRRADLELVVFAWFLGFQISWESLPPASARERLPSSSDRAPSKAAGA
ncbi:MAG: hypothetical protein QF724_07795 [Planctomycetota bacterium]|jgi:hypothetical protein|nr:hypothetical protein [Planctomycetota bacterium]MDP6838822.1 hypothetical protein [Planctomycetota bacterium]MDP6957038.1 hypothetical protein [Planctomycetota bacterium]